MVKKYLFLLFALVAMCSCGPARVETGYNEHSILEKFDHVRHFEYKGHKYIQFAKTFPASQSSMGIVHDPDCDCHENSN